MGLGISQRLLIFESILLMGLYTSCRAQAEPHVFQLRFVHPQSYEIVLDPGYAKTNDLSAYEKLVPLPPDHFGAYWVSKEVQIDERDLKEVRAELSEPAMTKAQLESIKKQHPDMTNSLGMDEALTRSEPQIVFFFTTEGEKKFSKLTTDNRGRLLAVIFDGKMIVAATIHEPMTGGHLKLHGPFLSAELRDQMVSKLNQIIKTQP